MSYQKLLDVQALKAFNKLKDLATDAVFVNKTVTGFDFDNGVINQTTEPPKGVKLVIIETKRKGKTITTTVMARVADIGLLDEYDTLTFQSKTWTVGPVVQQTARVVIFDIFREGA